jgi:polyphosphate kinase
MKMNSLSDPTVIDALYAASKAGVKVQLIIRGICCLRAGVPGLSDNITVRSLVGTFLEHSRIYYFAHGTEGPEFYLGSADLMPRNLDHRVEVIFPVDSRELQERLQYVLDIDLSDDEQAWELQPDSTWSRVPELRSVCAQRALCEDAIERANGAKPQR